MPIRTIEIICIPCEKCERAKKLIAETIKSIEIQNKVKIPYEFKHNPSLRALADYSINAAQAPAIVINGNVELSGRFDTVALKNRLMSLAHTA